MPADEERAALLRGLAERARAVEPVAFDFGAWAEAGRLAALDGRQEFFGERFARGLDGASRSPTAGDAAVGRELQALRALLADGAVAGAELADAARSLEQILLLH
jgi:hypothetical protein